MADEGRYEARLDSLPVGLYRSTPEGRFLYVNQTLVEMAGYPGREELLATPIYAIWYEPAERDVFLDRLQRESVLHGYEMRVRRYDGGVMWVRNSVHRLQDAEGRIFFDGVVEDVTERREAEEALARVEAQYRRQIDASPEAVAVHRGGAFVYVNSAACELIGAASPDELVGRTALDLVHPDDRDVVRARMERGYRDGQPGERLDERFVRLDGRVIEVEVASVPILWEGKPATQVLVRDVTAQRQAERHLRASETRLAEAQKIAALGTWELDPVARRFEASEELFRLAGVEPRRDGISFEETLALIHPEDRAAVVECLRRAVEHLEGFALDYRYLRPDGRTRTVHTRAEVSCDSTGRVVRVVGTAQDVTDRKQIEQELAEARDAALEASRLKSFFLANMSHEIRTPLNVILGYAALLSEHFEEAGDHSQDSLLEGIDRAARRLLDTVHGVLDLSKIETGTFSVDPETIDVVEILRREVADFAVLARRKGLELRLEAAPERCAVRFDEYCLSQALANLLSNALKFTAEGGVTVSLRGRPSQGAVIEVADTGVGIDTAYLPRLFDAFSQEQSGYTREFEGSGLGLALTRRYVELNGGRVSVESAKGRGSSFRIHLPPGDGGDAPEAGEPARSAEPVPVASHERSGVLLVEDEPDTQQYMKAVLGSRYELFVASTAGEARELLEGNRSRIRLVLMDLSLRGGEDGLSLTRSIRSDERFADLPVVATTAHAFVEDRDRCLEAGCDAYLAKPIAPSALVTTIEGLLRR